MRGIVTLAAAYALPNDFPHRDLIVLVAFSVVVGTLVINGLTLKPLLRALDLRDDDPVGREVEAAREHALHAGLASLVNETSPAAESVRREFAAQLPLEGLAADGTAEHHEFRRRALHAARRAVLEMRANDDIGDDAFHRVEEELDWLEMAVRTEGS